MTKGKRKAQAPSRLKKSVTGLENKAAMLNSIILIGDRHHRRVADLIVPLFKCIRETGRGNF